MATKPSGTGTFTPARLVVDQAALILKHTFDIVWQVDLAGRYVYLNEAFGKVLGYKAENFLGKVRDDFLLGDRTASTETVYREFAAGKDNLRLQYSYQGADGRIIHVESLLNPLRDETGAVTGFFGVSRDVTSWVDALDKSRFQQKLLECKDELSRLIIVNKPFHAIAENLLTKAVEFTSSMSGGIAYWDDNAGKFHCLVKPECQLGHSGWKAFTDETLPPWYRHLLTIESPKVLFSIPHPYEEQMPCYSHCQEILVAPCRVEDRTIGLITLCTEKGARPMGVKDLLLIEDFCRFFAQAIRYENLQRRLQLALEIYRGFENANLVGVFQLRFSAPINAGETPDHIAKAILHSAQFEYANDAMGQMYGFTSGSDLVGKPLADFFESEDYAIAMLREFVADGFRFTRGPIRQVSVQKAPKVFRVSSFGFLEDWQLTRIWGIQTDTSREMEMERQLVHSLKMEAVGTLSGGIAHDFNNILNGVLGYTSLLKMEVGQNAQALETVQEVEKLCLKAADLSSLLLGFARRKSANKVPLCLNDIASNMVKLVERTFRKDIRIETDLSPNLRSVEADAVQIESVVMNICINARDAMPQGGVLRLSTRNVFLDEPYVQKFMGLSCGDYVQVSIRDTGMGMSDEAMKRIFDPFYTTKKDAGGTGLGLSMVYSIMANHGGAVTVYSEEGHGSEFKLYFKAVPDTVVVQTDIPTETIGIVPGMRGAEKILLVDDDDIVRLTGQRLLERMGYGVEVAENGRIAVESFERDPGRFDLVVMDMIMPEMCGDKAFELMRKVRPDIRILVASGFSPDERVRKLLATGGSSFIQKPFLFPELSQAIRALLGQ